MTTRISSAGDLSTREWETLSAYLDEKLSPQEKAVLEKRLEENLELQVSLEDLRRTRSLLRIQPRMRAPRNFTLNPEMAGLRPGMRSLPSAYPVLRLASVLATIFFVLLSVSQLMLVGNQATSMVQPEFLAKETSAVGAEMLPQPSFGVGGGGSSISADKEAVSTEALPAEAPLALAPEQPTEVALEKMAGEPPQATPEAGILIVTPLGLPSTSTPSNELENADQVVSATKEISPQGQITEGVASPLRGYKERNALARGWTLLKAIQVFLAFLAVGTGLAAIWLHRSYHK